MYNDLYNKYIEEVLPVIETFDEEYYHTMNNIVELVWYNHLVGKNTCSTTQIEKLGDVKIFNKFVRRLSETGWIESDVNANFAFLTIPKGKIPKEEETNLTIDAKFGKYKLTNYPTTLVNKAKRGNKYYKAKFKREGFKLAGNFQYSFDTDVLIDNLEEIAEDCMKDLPVAIADVSYQDMISIILEYYTMANEWYNLEDNISDSRGRAIFQCTKRIFNPIGFKTARALMKIKPIKLTKQGEKYVYLFIAELFKNKLPTLSQREQFGRDMYKTNTYPIDCSLDVRIWLFRLYRDLKANKKEWDIPISIDACASLAQLSGCLLNDKELLSYTNLIGNRLEDIWTIDGIPRKLVKSAAQPLMYGSSATIQDLWKKSKLPYTIKQVVRLKEEVDNGRLKAINNFKDFTISNCNLKPKFTAIINGEEVEVECNRYTTTPSIHSMLVYTTSQRTVKPINRIEYNTPDLERFRLFTQTLLLHCSDSQIMNKVCIDLDGNFMPIHDSMTCHPNLVHKIKQSYRNHIYDVYKNREKIIREYYTSIGIEEELINQFVDKYNIKGEDIKTFNLSGLL